MESIDPQKYFELQEKLQQEAKAEAIALLRDKVENHAIVIDDIDKQISDHDWIVTKVGNIHIEKSAVIILSPFYKVNNLLMIVKFPSNRFTILEVEFLLRIKLFSIIL